MGKRPMTPYENARINEQQAMRNAQEAERRIEAPRNELLDDIAFKLQAGPYRHEMSTRLPEIKWREMTPAERAVHEAAYGIAAAGQRGPEQGRFGYFRGMIIITHPDMPPHVWDGKTMHRIEPQEG